MVRYSHEHYSPDFVSPKRRSYRRRSVQDFAQYLGFFAFRTDSHASSLS
jgi:hypothetical protein